MRAPLRFAVYLYVCLLIVIVVQSKTEQDLSDELSFELLGTETTTEANKMRMVNLPSLQANCKFVDDVLTKCSGFDFASAKEVAFFELSSQVRIAPDGATYELGAKQLLASLVIENSTFANFPLHLFYELPLLQELDMRHNGIQHISWESFLAADKLNILLLADNTISELGESVFAYAKQLTFLFLNNNQLEQLHPKAFSGLQKLNHLDLSDNQLKQLPDGIFDDLRALQHLNLANNHIELISDELLTHCEQLKLVVLQGNRLYKLGEYAFSPVMQLMLLDVSHNQPLEELVLNVKADHLLARNCSLNRVNLYGVVGNVDLGDNRVQELYFSNPEMLENLVLRNNSLVQLATLSRVPRLRLLNVANNPELRDLPSDWLDLPLQMLDLSNTGLDHLPEVVVRGMPQLRKLNVSVNNISEIPTEHFDHLSQLTHFFVHKNNWSCSNLNLVMNSLILKHGITYTPDEFDAASKREYISNIACVDRSPEKLQLKLDCALDSTECNSGASVEKEQNGLSEVQQLREEFKVIVQHFEEKFDMVFAQLNKLKTQMSFLENLNSSLFQQMTIVV